MFAVGSYRHAVGSVHPYITGVQKDPVKGAPPVRTVAPPASSTISQETSPCQEPPSQETVKQSSGKQRYAVSADPVAIV